MLLRLIVIFLPLSVALLLAWIVVRIVSLPCPSVHHANTTEHCHRSCSSGLLALSYLGYCSYVSLGYYVVHYTLVCSARKLSCSLYISPPCHILFLSSSSSRLSCRTSDLLML
ncbi:hypothetical protein DAEQUDRAFT_213672 [Daedalea quercina L-15889]|uniref:Uncharacterized protein n=1 Tax=Daedalea quercina L-15889 TaxID=1314783 RepID=A0A165R353_9APHY|nr:hypothetical protein DAEQUDRAFT_213672 [Daedalea quercina L-15889]